MKSLSAMGWRRRSRRRDREQRQSAVSAADRLEASADGAALVRSVLDHDAEAGRAVMDSADHEAVCDASPGS